MDSCCQLTCAHLKQVDASGLEEELRLSVPPPLPPELDLPPLPSPLHYMPTADIREDQFLEPPSDFVLTPRSKGLI